jgi:anthranilate synthase component 1
VYIAHGEIVGVKGRSSVNFGRHRPIEAEAIEPLASGRIVPIVRRLVADDLTPVSAYARLTRGGSGPSFLFESVVGGERVGRFSFVGAAPFSRFRAWGHRVRIETGDQNAQEFESPDPLLDLERHCERHRVVAAPGLPRFTGGAVGYASYDSVRYVERLGPGPADDRGLPDLDFGLYDQMVVFDHIRKLVLAVGLAMPGADPRDSYASACAKIDRMVERLGATDIRLPPVDVDLNGPAGRPARSNFSREAYEKVVRACQEYIRAGDIFQVVPSQRFELDVSATPLEIYRALRIVNPSPFLFLLDHGDHALIGSSPEILVRVEDGTVTIRPIAGTRRRGADEAEDQRLAAELLADPKERAEHIMLVDLGRNDVGRVADAGTVELTELMCVERYSHVMHITSNVTGRLSPGKTAFDALRAGLPAGTVSGAPKVRAMEIIDEVEPVRRGPYGGAVGYIDFSGNMDTCIALRTVVIQKGRAFVQAGGGVVFDSVPGEEYDETVNKATAMIRAIEIAETQLHR